jgi:hypothetical protein
VIYLSFGPQSFGTYSISLSNLFSVCLIKYHTFTTSGAQGALSFFLLDDVIAFSSVMQFQEILDGGIRNVFQSVGREESLWPLSERT